MLALRDRSVTACDGVLIAANMLSMQLCARTRMSTASLPRRETTAFKFLDPLSRVATYPSGALRRAGASSGRAIVIAVRDTRRGRRGVI